jgi:hypothetical protein
MRGTFRAKEGLRITAVQSSHPKLRVAARIATISRNLSFGEIAAGSVRSAQNPPPGGGEIEVTKPGPVGSAPKEQKG